MASKHLIKQIYFLWINDNNAVKWSTNISHGKNELFQIYLAVDWSDFEAKTLQDPYAMLLMII